MGIYSRDYIREDYGSAGGGWSGREAFKILLIANVAVFVLQHVFPPLTDWLSLNPELIVERFQIWRLATYEFCHGIGDIWHLVFNMWLLYLAGRKVEGQYGSREFMAFYFAAGILSGLFSVGLSYALQDYTPAVGASGAVAAVMILYACHWPRDQWYIFGIIPVTAMWLAIISVVMDLWPVLRQFGGGRDLSGVAHAVHLGGMLFAYLYYRGQWRVSTMFDWAKRSNLRRLRTRSKLRVVRPEEEAPPASAPAPGPAAADFEVQVDRLLQKVQDHGEASLTDAERAVLTEAGRRYRERR